MGANSVKVLKQLGVSEETPIFRFRNPEVAAKLEPPHLLTCTHKLYLRHDIVNVGCQSTGNGDLPALLSGRTS